jgi:hypothetical protein
MHARPLMLPALLLSAALLTACGVAPPRSGAAPGAVSVSWNDTAGFAEARTNRRESAAAREAWVSALGRHLAEQVATVLPPDETLEVRFTDIQRVGGYSPPRGPQADQVRTVRDGDTPRITLEFTRRGKDGQLRRSGRQELRDLSALQRPPRYQGDALAAEKMLLDDWVRQQYGDPR